MTKLAVSDIQNILQLISSDRLALKGNEARDIVQLQDKLISIIQEAMAQPSLPSPVLDNSNVNSVT